MDHDVLAPVGDTIYDEPAYRRSRKAYTIECAFEYFVALLVGDAFLAKLLSAIGLSDAFIGIISSLVSLAFLFQLFSVFIIQRIRNIKRFVIIFHSVGQLFFSVLYLIPFLPIALPYRKVLVVAVVLISYFGNYCVTSMLYKWCNSFVQPDRRARFSATKEMISLASGVVMSLTLGYVMDSFFDAGNQAGAFLFAAGAILIFSTVDFVCLLLVRRDFGGKAEPTTPASAREVIAGTLGNRTFRHIVILTVLFDMARYITIGFLGVYRVNDLLFTVGTVQLINMVGNLSRFFLSRPFGRFSDKRGYARGIELAMCLTAVAFVFQAVTVPATRWLILGYAFFYNVSMAGIVQNMHSILYSYVDSRYFVQAAAIKNSIGGLAGFGAALLGAKILAAVQGNGNAILGVNLYGQQLLAVISLVLLVAAILYNRLVILPQRVMRQ